MIAGCGGPQGLALDLRIETNTCAGAADKVALTVTTDPPSAAKMGTPVTATGPFNGEARFVLLLPEATRKVHVDALGTAVGRTVGTASADYNVHAPGIDREQLGLAGDCAPDLSMSSPQDLAAQDLSANGDLGDLQSNDLLAGDMLPSLRACGSLSFDATGTQTLSMPHIAAYNPTTDVTVEVWVRPRSVPGSETRLLGHGDATGAGSNWDLRLESDGKTAFCIKGMSDSTISCAHGATVLPLHGWSHVAGVFTSGQARLFVNGTEDATPLSVATLLKAITGDVSLGGAAWSTVGVDGDFDSARVSNIARYSADFTPPKALPSDGNTILAFDFDETAPPVHDAARPGATITESGSLVPVCTPIRCGGVTGGGFTSSDSKLTGIPPFITIEAWVQPSDLTGQRVIASHWNTTSDGTASWAVYLDSGRLAMAISCDGMMQSGLTDSQTLPKHSWSFVVAQFDTAAFKMSLSSNGRVGAEQTGSCGPHSLAGIPFDVGGASPDYSAFSGEIDELRVSRATRLTGAVFTPPDTLGTDNNTVALYHFDDAVGQSTDAGSLTATDSASSPAALTSLGNAFNFADCR